MTMARHVFTSESVTEGHPDKIADQISDSVLDAILGPDPEARVACETLVTTGMAIVAGGINTTPHLHAPHIGPGPIQPIRHTDANSRFDNHTRALLLNIDHHSPDNA